MKISPIIQVGILGFSVCSYGATVYSVSGSGVQPFGPNETQASACEIAESRAKKDALAKHFGEVVGQESFVDCDSRAQDTSGNDCELFESTWSLLNANGVIKGSESKKEKISFSQELKSSVCSVTATYLIEEFVGQADPNFIVDIEIPLGTILRERENVTLVISSSMPAHHVVFNWSPYMDKDNYYLIYPNDMDMHAIPARRMEVPSDKRIVDYYLEASLPPDISSAAEYIMLVSFLDKPTAIPSKLSKGDFVAWLQGYDRSRWSTKKYSYRVIGE